MVKNIIIAALLICNFLLLQKVIDCNNTIDYEMQNSEKLFLSNIICNDYKDIIQNDTCRFVTPNLYFQNSNFDDIDFDDIINNDKKLIIRYSELNCNSCVDSLLKMSHYIAKKIGKEKIQVWADYSNKRNYMLFLRMNKWDVDIYKVEGEVSKLDKINEPYMFVLNQDMTMSHFFIPHKEIPKWTNWYMSEVVEYLND